MHRLLECTVNKSLVVPKISHSKEISGLGLNSVENIVKKCASLFFSVLTLASLNK